MALKIDINTDYDVIASYWAITHYRYIFSNGKCEIEISGWKNKNAYQAFKKHYISYNYVSDVNLSNMNQMYTFVKTQPEFLTAIVLKFSTIVLPN